MIIMLLIGGQKLQIVNDNIWCKCFMVCVCLMHLVYIVYCLTVVCREEESLVDMFVFELLVTFIESLALAHSDDKALGNYSYVDNSLRVLSVFIVCRKM